MDYFANHGWLMLFMWACFPRISFWFLGAMTGGIGFWLGVFFVPHVMVAYWATHYYWDTNPVLCIIAWMCALGGSSSESKIIKKEAS